MAGAPEVASADLTQAESSGLAQAENGDLPKAETSEMPKAENNDPDVHPEKRFVDLEPNLNSMLDNPPDNINDPIKRLCSLVDSSRPHNVQNRVPLTRFCGMLKEVYDMAQRYVDDNLIDKAFVYYLRYLGIAVEELTKHSDYENLSEETRLTFTKYTVNAINKAEILKRELKKAFDRDALEYSAAEEAKKKLQPEEEPKEEPAPPPTITGNLRSYTTCERRQNPLFQRIILPNDLPVRFLEYAEDGKAFGRLYGKMYRNTLIVSHIIMSNGNDDDLEKTEKIIHGPPNGDDEPSDFILVGAVCHSFNDPLMQKFMSMALTSEIVCIIIPEGEKKCCVFHLNNLPCRDGNVIPPELMKSLSSAPQVNKEQMEETPTSSPVKNKAESSSPQELHQRMCKHAYVTPTLKLLLMPYRNPSNDKGDAADNNGAADKVNADNKVNAADKVDDTDEQPFKKRPRLSK